MYTTESLEQFTTVSEFINFNNPSELNKVQDECAKLLYLRTYPSKVRAQIRALTSQAALLQSEITAQIKEGTTPLNQIKMRQTLAAKYDELKDIKEQLYKAKEELRYAEYVKIVAGMKMKIYHELLDKHNTGGDVNGNNRDKKQFRLTRTSYTTRTKY